MAKKKKAKGIAWDMDDRPITEDGADLIARRFGYRFAGYYDTGDPEFADRFMAIFLPEPDDRSHAILTDGRTRHRSLRRGLRAIELGVAKKDLEENP
jgi:hypothetical protein